MPRNYRRVTPKYRAKRNYVNRRKYRQRRARKRAWDKPKTRVDRTLTGISDRLLTKMRYTDFVTITPTASTYGSYVFRGNSIYDPDYAFGGHQPLSYDQWFNFYQRYRVFGSKCSIQALSRSNTTINSNLIISLIPSTALYTGTEPRTAVEAPYSKYKVLGTANATNGVFISNYMSTKKIYGEKSLDDDGYSAFMTSSPISEWFWNLQIQNMQGTTAFDGATFIVSITYYVELYDRHILAMS